MQADEAAGVGKQAYRDYQQALRRWLIPYFGATDIAKVDLAGLTAFDQWRTKELGRVPAQSTINNHNAALNRVLDEAELRGWITKSLRPILLNKGVETQSRGTTLHPRDESLTGFVQLSPARFPDLLENTDRVVLGTPLLPRTSCQVIRSSGQ